MAGRLAGKIALITGGGSGIGRACAIRFAEEGANVCAADRDGATAAETARLVEAKGRKAFSLAVDTTDEAANDAMVARCVESLGGVDVLIAAAGVGSPRTASDQPHTLLGISTEQFRAVIDVNLYGVLFSNRAVARLLVANHRAGQHRQSRLDHVEDALGGRRLQREQGRRVDADQDSGPGARPAGDPRERDRARIHRDPNDRGAARRCRP